MNGIFETRNADETFSIGERLGATLENGDVVSLIGGLGAGKTVLAKGIAKGLGVAEEVTSPTFTLLRQYQGRLTLCHYDLYRIEDEEELEHIGFYDDLGKDSVCVIEWPQIASGLRANIHVHITGNGNDTRQIKIISDEAKDVHTGG